MDRSRLFEEFVPVGFVARVFTENERAAGDARLVGGLSETDDKLEMYMNRWHIRLRNRVCHRIIDFIGIRRDR